MFFEDDDFSTIEQQVTGWIDPESNLDWDSNTTTEVEKASWQAKCIVGCIAVAIVSFTILAIIS